MLNEEEDDRSGRRLILHSHHINILSMLFTVVLGFFDLPAFNIGTNFKEG